MSTIKNEAGEELPLYTEEQIDALLASTDPAKKSGLMKFLKALGKSVTEIFKMSPEEKKAYILSRYRELGGKAKGKPGRPPAAAGLAKGKAKKEPEEEPEETEETPDESAGADTSALQAQVQELQTTVADLQALVSDASALILDSHHILRCMLGALGLDESDVVGLKDAYYAQPLITPDAGND